MKPKEKELALLGLQEINESEKKETAGGILPWRGIFGPILICCIDIPPAEMPIGDYII